MSSDNTVYFAHPGICTSPPSLCPVMFVPRCCWSLLSFFLQKPDRIFWALEVIRPPPYIPVLNLWNSYLIIKYKDDIIYIYLTILHRLVHGIILQSQHGVKGTFAVSRGMVNTNQTHIGHGHTPWRMQSCTVSSLMKKNSCLSCPSL